MASIQKRETGTGKIRYRVRWIQDGKHESATLPTKEAARKFRSRVEAAGDRWPADTHTEVPTFEAYVERYFDSKSGITARTRSDYRRDVTNYLLPTFGAIPLDMIDWAMIGGWVQALEGQRAPKTIANLHALLSGILGKAVTDKLLSENPAENTTLPELPSPPDCYLSPQDFDLIRSCIPREDDKALATLLVGTGLRWGEASALEVDRHVDLLAAKPQVRVEQAWKRQPDSSYVLGTPKTKRSNRTVTIGPEVVDALISQVAAKPAGALVFPGRDGGRYRHANFYRVWQPAVAKARKQGLEKQPRVHDLRHTHASWLIGAGVPLPVVQRRLGHESITVTVDRYGHLSPDLDYGVTDAITAALSSAAGPPPDQAAFQG